MWNMLVKWLKAPIFEDNPEKTRQAGVLWITLSVALIMVPVYLASFFIANKTPNIEGLITSLSLEVIFFAMILAVRFGYVRVVGYVLSTAFWLAGTVAAFMFSGLREMALEFHYLVLIVAATTIGLRAVTGYFLLSVVAYAFLLFGEYQGWITYTISAPTTYDDVIVPVILLFLSTLLLRNAIRSLKKANEQSKSNADALEKANFELRSAQEVLAQQTVDLQRRTRFLEATTAVAQDTALLLDQPERVFNQIVSTLASHFGMYHVGLYLLAAGGSAVQLVAASTEAGKRLVQQGFHLPVSDKPSDRSIPGWVITHEAPYVTANVDEELRFRVLPGLLETRSEVALPVRAQGRVIGVLDFQSNTARESYRESDIEMLQLIVGQAGMVINNAQLVSQLGTAVETQRRLAGEVGRENWLELIRAGTDNSFVGTGTGVTKSGRIWSDEMQSAVNKGAATVSASDPRMLAVPVRARGEVVAVIDATLPEGMPAWTPDTIEALEAMAEQLGTALEGVRLYQQTRERAATEQMTREVTTAMRSTLDVDGVLQAALREISEVLQVQQVQVRLGTGGTEAGA